MNHSPARPWMYGPANLPVAHVDVELEDRLRGVSSNEIDDLLAASAPRRGWTCTHPTRSAPLHTSSRAVPSRSAESAPTCGHPRAGSTANSFALPHLNEKTCHMTFVVRQALPQDGMAMGALHVAAWRSAYVGVAPDSYLDRARCHLLRPPMGSITSRRHPGFDGARRSARRPSAGDVFGRSVPRADRTGRSDGRVVDVERRSCRVRIRGRHRASHGRRANSRRAGSSIRRPVGRRPQPTRSPLLRA